jgi:ribosomal protein S18
MEISYYELLGMVQEGNAPEKIEVRLCGDRKAIYKADYDGDEFSHYRIDEYEDENYHTYLSECLLESSMFDKCIKILDDEDEFEDVERFGIHYSWDYIDYKNIEELKKYVNKDFQNIFDTLDKLIKNQKKIIEKIKELEK